MTQIHELTMTGLAAAIHERQLSPVDVTNHYLRRTEELNAQVGAFYTVTAELALEQARAAEKAVTGRSGSAPLPPLLGVPIPIKDLNSVADVRQTFGSSVYADYVPAGDDYVVAAIRSAGAVITGKTATPNSAFRVTPRRPLGRPPGRHGILPGRPGGPAAERPPRWPHASPRPRRAAMAAGLSASPPACAGCSVSSRPAAGCPRGRSCRTCSGWPPTGRSPGPWRMPPCCWT